MSQRRLTARTTLMILTGLNLFNYIDRYVLSSVLESIKGEMHLSDTQLGWLGTAFMLGYFLTCPIFGYLGDRISRKWLIAAGIFVWSLGTVLTGFATDYWHLIVFRIIIGFGEASYATLSPGIISDLYAPDKRNNAYTWYYTAIPLGAAIGFTFGGFMASHFGWHHAFFWSGAPGLLLAFILLPFQEPRRGESEGLGAAKDSEPKPSIRDVFGLLKIKKYNLTVFGYVAYTFAMGAYAFWAPTFLTRVHKMSTVDAGKFVGVVMAGGGIFGTLAGGFFASWWQKRYRGATAMTMALSALFAVPLTALMLVTPDPVLARTYLAAAVVFLFVSTGPVNTLTIESSPVNLRASAMAGQIFLIHLFGDVWSPTIVGAISKAADDNLSRGLAITPWALFACFAFWFWLALEKTKKPKTA